MGRGYVSPDLLCSAHNRRGKPCKLAAIPFGTVCTKHGGLAPQALAAADRRRAVAERGMSGEPASVVKEKVRRWYALQDRLARREMKRTGVLADFDAEAERRDQRQRAAALRELAPEYLAAAERERQEAVEAVKGWAAGGQIGPRPWLPGDEPTAEQPTSDLLAAPERPQQAEPQQAEPQPSHSDGFSEPIAAPEPQPRAAELPRGEWPEPTRPAEPEPERLKLLQYERTAARAARQRPKRPRPSGQVLPGGGRIHDAELPIPAAEYERQRRGQVEAIPYAGAITDWEI